MKITIEEPGFYFTWVYLISFFVVFLLVIRESLKKGYPLRQVFLLLSTASLMAVIGSRLFTIPFIEWGDLISSGSITTHNSRSAIGGLLFGLIGLVYAQRFLGFDKSILDMYAWISPIGFGLQRIGCLLNGCCYGKLSTVPWAVQYPKNTHAHFDHWSSNTIAHDALFSSSVHPVPFYEMLLFFAIAYIVWRYHKVFQRNGSSLLLSFSLIFIFRSASQYMRAPVSAKLGNLPLLGIPIFVWVLLFIGLMSILMLIINERYMKYRLLPWAKTEPAPVSLLFHIFLLSALTYVFRGLFASYELIALSIRFVPAVILTGVYFYSFFELKKPITYLGLFLIFPLIIMAQAFPEGEKTSYNKIDVGISLGDVHSETRYNPQEGDCSTQYTADAYKNTYQVGGIGFSRVIESKKWTRTFGATLFGGVNKELNLKTNETGRLGLYGISLYDRFDFAWIGLGYGLNFGKNRWISTKAYDLSHYYSSTKTNIIRPSFSIRVGRRDILDLKYDFENNFPSPYPALTHRLSLGSGFGFKKGYSLRYGYSLPTGSNNIEAKMLINKKIGLNMMYVFGKNHSVGDSLPNTNMFVFGMNYRFGHTTSSK